MRSAVPTYRNLIAIITLLVMCLSGPVRAQQRAPVILSKDLKITDLTEGVFKVTHSFPWAANALIVVVSPSEIVLVDTPYTNGATELVVEWIYSTFGQIQITAINTGFHADNLGGNGCLLQKGIPIHGADLTGQLVQELGRKAQAQVQSYLEMPEQQRFHDAMDNAQFHAPDHIFKIRDGLHLTIGDEDIDVYYPGPSHTRDSVVVWFPKRKLLFGGCMVKALESTNLGNTADADVPAWPAAIRKVQKKFGDAQVVVPGHGDHGDTRLLGHTLALLKQNQDLVILGKKDQPVTINLDQ
jgi:glyoxylase-like metal-dependent hydrolase (beta-lactamase superfamily II)